MSIAEKLTTIAENQQKVYDAGVAVGRAEGDGGSFEEGYNEGFAEGFDSGWMDGLTQGLNDGYDSGLEEGKQAEYDRFWDAYQGNGGNYRSAFTTLCWTDEIYNPNQDIVCTVSGESMFQNNDKITNTKVPIIVRGCTANYMFNGCTALKTVPYIGLFGATGNSSLSPGCGELENITFDGSIDYGIGFANSGKLTNESVQSIIDHLKDATGQTSLKIVFHSSVVERLTDEQYEQIANKNWYIG